MRDSKDDLEDGIRTAITSMNVGYYDIRGKRPVRPTAESELEGRREVVHISTDHSSGRGWDTFRARDSVILELVQRRESEAATFYLAGPEYGPGRRRWFRRCLKQPGARRDVTDIAAKRCP